MQGRIPKLKNAQLSRAALPAAAPHLPRGPRGMAEPPSASRSRRPSIEPDLGERIVLAQQLRAQFDGFLATGRELKTQTRSADLGIGLRHDVAHLALVGGDRNLDVFRLRYPRHPKAAAR